MTTAEWALMISMFSAVVAGCALGWNIYRDVVLKARLKVTVGIGNILAEGREPSRDYIMLEATNHGPGTVKLETIRLQKNAKWLKFLRRTQHAVIVHDYMNPLSGKLPLTLDVGERSTYLFPFEKDCFLSGEFTHVGLRDSFGRTHWASRSAYSNARQRWVNAFGKES